MAFHFTPTHKAVSSDHAYDVMAVQINDEVWCYSSEEAQADSEPALVLDVREMPRSGVVAEEGRVHFHGKPVHGWCLKRLTAILDFVPNGPGLTSRELDDRTVADDPPEHDPEPEVTVELDADAKPSRKRQRIKAIKEVAPKVNAKAKAKKTVAKKLTELVATDQNDQAIATLEAKVDEFCAAVDPASEDPEGVDEAIVAAIEKQVRNEPQIADVEPQAAPEATGRRTLVAEAIRILQAKRSPMTGKEIAAVVLADGTLPHTSKDLTGTVAARMHERPHIFSKTAPGTFGLVEWGLPAADPREKRKLEPTVRLSLTDAKALVEKGPQAIDALLKLKSFVEAEAAS
jgi:hypothetical protein